MALRIKASSLDRLVSSFDDADVCRLLGLGGVELGDLKIRTKPPNSRLVGYEPNETQVMFLDDIQAGQVGFDWRSGKYELSGLRLDVLKYRQWGCSTTTILLYLLDCLNNPLTQTRVMAHNPQTTTDLFEIVRTAYDHLPAEKKPLATVYSRGEIAWPNGSRFQVLLLGSKGAGRGGTVKNLLESERAFWGKEGNEIEFGLLQSVPYGGNVVRETTANGLEEFYEQYQMARAGQSEYRALFYGWSPHKEYEYDVPVGFAASQEEINLRELYGLTDGQLMFRRVKTDEAKRLGKSFEQEYPLTADEAFVASGNPYYNRQYLQQRLREVEVLYSKGESPANVLSQDEGFVPGVLEVFQGPTTWLPSRRLEGKFVEDQPPVKCEYVIGADVAEGIHDDKDHDYSTADVFRVDTWEQVASFWGRCDPVDFANLLDWLGKEYNEAEIAVERNNHGGTVLARMIELAYPRLYYHRVVRTVNGEHVEDLVAGYPKTQKTKPHVDNMLGVAIHEAAQGLESVVLNARRAIAELIHYVKLPGGKAGGEGRAHDDHNTSVGLGVYLLNERGRGYFDLEEDKYVPMYGNASRLRGARI